MLGRTKLTRVKREKELTALRPGSFYFFVPNNALITDVIFYKVGRNISTDFTLKFYYGKTEETKNDYNDVTPQKMYSLNFYLKSGGLCAFIVSNNLIDKAVVFYEY